ncbi:MAG: Lipopolysaccharide biosynthesis glycosyltransferase [Ignavibacteriae bacterium]|nr:MAG: Lipopolysaccharide biosynthesis glycosyltransferase [Ignavibacteriota bacterium]
MNIVPICFFFDHKIVIPAGVSISTLLESAKPDTFYEIYIFHPGDLVGHYAETITKLKAKYNNCNFTFLDMHDKFNNAHVLRGIPNVTYYRLLVPEVLPQYDKIIVSDVDIIFNVDLADLYNEIEFDGCYLAAVKNAIVKNSYVKSIGCDPLLYVNCGFFIYNSLQIRKDEIYKKFYELVGKKYFYLDQDIINIICKNKIKYIHPKYNLSQSFYQKYYQDIDWLKKLYSDIEIQEAFNALFSYDEGIIHYNGINPWENICWRHDLWWEKYRYSMYFDDKYYYRYYMMLQNPNINYMFKKLIKISLKKYIGNIKKKIFDWRQE